MRLRRADGRVPARRVSAAWGLTTACLLLLLIDSRLATAAVPAGRPTPPGVVLRRLRMPGPVRAVMLRIDPEVMRFDVVPARPGGGGYATLRRLAQRHHALVAINGDFSSEGWPAHLLMHDGRLLTSGDAYGAAFAFDATGTRASVVTAHAPIAAVRLDTGSRIGIARWNAGDPPATGWLHSPADRRRRPTTRRHARRCFRPPLLQDPGTGSMSSRRDGGGARREAW